MNTMSLDAVKRLSYYIKTIEESNSTLLLIALYENPKLSSYQISQKIARDIGAYLSAGSVDLRIDSFLSKNLVSYEGVPRGKGKRKVYSLTAEGEKLVLALKKFLEALE